MSHLLVATPEAESIRSAAGELSHKLRNVFNVMSTNLAVAQKSLPAKAKTQEYLERVEHGIAETDALLKEFMCQAGPAEEETPQEYK